MTRPLLLIVGLLAGGASHRIWSAAVLVAAVWLAIETGDLFSRRTRPHPQNTGSRP